MSGAEKPTPEKSVEDFLLRWSRRKLGVADPDDHLDASAPPPSSEARGAESAPPAEAPPEAASAFDPKSLPPVESIDATTDIRAFLAPRVPIELTRAALRRAWTSDPAIRDFVGIAENQWDFTKPDSVPGFGSLEFGEELRGMVARLFGEMSESRQNPAQRSGTSEGTQQAKFDAAAADAPTQVGFATPSLTAPPPQPRGDSEGDAAAQNDSGADERGLTSRRHGGALPK